jgi:hypothetical protein
VPLKLHISGFPLHWPNYVLRERLVVFYVLSGEPLSFASLTAKLFSTSCRAGRYQ